MTEFEELRSIHRIQGLLLERLKERTDSEIRALAKRIAKEHKLSLAAAYEDWEATLLDTNPEAGRWQ